MNRPYDPVLGRFWGIDALSDLMPAISPMAYAYNNPLLFFDPTGLTGGIPGCPDCKGINVGEVTITAPRLLEQDYSAMFYDLANHSNPVYRNIGVQFERGNYDYLSHAFNQRAISYGEGIGYETEFMKGLNSIGEGLTTGLLYASFGAMAAPIVVYGSPLLIKSGAFSLSGGFNTGAVLTRVGIEAGSQGIANMLQFGFTKDAVNNIDFADIMLAGLGMNYLGSSFIGASLTLNVESGFSIQNNSRDFTRDLTVGLVSGGQHNLLKKSQITPQLIEVFNGFNQVKAKGLGVASDYLKNEKY